MRKIWNLVAVILLTAGSIELSIAQGVDKKLYNPEADAENDIKRAVAQAKSEGKHVFIQIGGNWCVWCHRFNDTVMSNDTLNGILHHSYVPIHVNYSPENKNEKVLASLGYPQRFGFPVFVVLDQNGQRIHTQNSGYLEDGKGHSTKEIFKFLYSWTPVAIDPDSYK